MGAVRVVGGTLDLPQVPWGEANSLSAPTTGTLHHKQGKEKLPEKCSVYDLISVTLAATHFYHLSLKFCFHKGTIFFLTSFSFNNIH